MRGSPVTARELAALITGEHGEGFKVNYSGQWEDHVAGSAVPVSVDIGDGWQPAVRITRECHATVLIGPFSLATRPSHFTKLMVYCDTFLLMSEPN